MQVTLESWLPWYGSDSTLKGFFDISMNGVLRVNRIELHEIDGRYRVRMPGYRSNGVADQYVHFLTDADQAAFNDQMVKLTRPLIGQPPYKNQKQARSFHDPDWK